MSWLFNNFLTIVGISMAFLMICLTYRWLWHSLFRIKLLDYQKERVLLKLSLILSIAFITIICIFGFIYLFLTIMQAPFSENYILHQKSGNIVEWHQVSTFIYFSAVTYFSLGYGDYVPAGTKMQFIILLESLIGYINSGLLIAYGFDIFKRTSNYLR